MAAGWGWGALLLGWFIASAALTRWSAREKAAATRAVLDPTHVRSAVQVFANGGLFAAAALLATLTGDAAWALAAAGALAAAASDTWATEVGLAIGGRPRSILSGRPVDPGRSGGVTAAGFVGATLGAAGVAVAAAPLVGRHTVWPAAIFLVAGAGVAGGIADSVLGATLQGVRRCPACATETERQVHDCGSPTEHAQGLPWMTNDLVNLLATGVGAGTATALHFSTY